MQKIIAAFDGLKYSESTAAYAIEIAKKYGASLVGVFLEDFTYHSFGILDLAGEEGAEERLAVQLAKADRATRDASVKLFRQSCRKAGLECLIHRDRNIAIQELLHESLYADLLVLQNNETLTSFAESGPTHFIVRLLEKIECPVLLVPAYYEKPDKVIFMYNGEPSSVFAIKQFSYLFRNLTLPVEIISARLKNEPKVIPDIHLLKEWLKPHYPAVEYKVLQGDIKEELIGKLKQEVKHPIVVLGAYERGVVSRWLNKSMADLIIEELNVPVYIAHK